MPPRSSTAWPSTGSRSPSRWTCARSRAASTGPTPHRRRRRGSSRSARSSARPRSSTIWAPTSTRTAGSPSACCGRATRHGGSPANAACCAVCSCPAPTTSSWHSRARSPTIDQSKVWPAGTCLGIDPATNQPTDIPIDCAAPHAMEVTGSVNLAEKFPPACRPSLSRTAFIKDACTRMTDAYLAPIQLRSTTLTLIYSTISLPSWAAGSHQVSCSIGATLGQRRLVDAAQQRQGPADDQRSAADPAARHPRRTPEPAADPDAATASDSSSRRQLVVIEVVGVNELEDTITQQRSDSAHAALDRHRNRRADPGAGRAEQHVPERGNTFLNGPPPPPPPGELPPPAPVCPPSAAARAGSRPRTGPRRPSRCRCRAATATATAGAVAGGRADEPATVRRAGLRRARPDSAGARVGDRQRRRPGRRPQRRRARPARALRGHRADRARLVVRGGIATRHDHDLPRGAARHLRHRSAGRRRGRHHGHPRDRPPLRHRRRPAARTGLGLTPERRACGGPVPSPVSITGP